MCNYLLLLLGIGFIFHEVDLAPDFYWRHYNHGDVPYDALEAHPGLYIGQAHFSTGLLPASIYHYRNSAVAMLGPRVNVTKHLKELKELKNKDRKY
ncbi:hypothetical protein QE152_g33750 [Popillia japonica]|uniref:Uncharacterized protein n=1 Tax=Popillia japonica TaxID=7064 RepID=A0AAW1IVT6_POPJA